MIKVCTLCSGYDSQCLALNRLGVDYDLVAWAEIDAFAIQAHNVLFPQFQERNLGDITSISWDDFADDIDLLTYSTPCQSISKAGAKNGMKKGSGTRSSVIWSVINCIKAKRPKYLVMENVDAIVNKKNIGDFTEWQNSVSELGYNNYVQILNAKDYGVPQNRKRVFMVSVRKDIDTGYKFPEPFALVKRLRDVLEDDVPEIHYASDKVVERFVKDTTIENYKTITLRRITTDRIILKGNTSRTGHCGENVYSINGIAPTINATCSMHTPMIQINCPRHNGATRIRKLTDRELFRLMDVSEYDIDALLSCGISTSQLKKLAGNSIVVNVLCAVFDKLLTKADYYV